MPFDLQGQATLTCRQWKVEQKFDLDVIRAAFRSTCTASDQQGAQPIKASVIESNKKGINHAQPAHVTAAPDTLAFQLATSADILDCIKSISLNAASVRLVKVSGPSQEAELDQPPAEDQEIREVIGWRRAPLGWKEDTQLRGLQKISWQAAEHRGAMGQDESRPEELDLAQIQELCILFMKECPSGALHLHEFKRIFGVPSSSVEESLYIETIFRSFDTNKVKRAVRLHPGPGTTPFLVPPGQHAGLPGVRGRAALDFAGKP